MYLNDTSWPVKLIESKRIKRITSLIDPRAGETILDLGCGAGDMLLELKKIIDKKGLCPGDVRLYGADASGYMLERSRERVGQGVEFVKCLSEELPFEDSFFDKIICSEVVEHVEDLGRTLSEMSRVLRPGGVFAISYPNEDIFNLIKGFCYFLKLDKLLFPGEYKPERNMLSHWHRRKINPQEFRKELAREGLGVTKEYGNLVFIRLRHILYGNK